MAGEVKFNATVEEMKTIRKCVDRYKALRKEMNIAEKFDATGCVMDLNAAHSNDAPLDFEKLLGFNNFEFLHDMAGIGRKIDRSTGKLRDCFTPRCAR